MKTSITIATAFALCVCASPAMSQTKQHSKEQHKKKSEETVIIRNSAGTTTVEVKDGDVYINGEKMADGQSGNANNRKIIIKNGNGRSSFNWNDDEELALPQTRKAMLGVYTAPNDNIAGAEIDMVAPSSGADKAGLQKGDIITRVDDIGIKDGKQLTELISKHEAGDKIAITYERDGKKMRTDATLSPVRKEATVQVYKWPHDMNNMEMPNTMMNNHPFMFDITNELPDAKPKMGATVEDLADGNGVRILSAKPGSAAENAGLQRDDVIKSMNGETILSVDDLQSIISSSKRNEAISLSYERKGKPYKTTITFPKSTRKKDL